MKKILTVLLALVLLCTFCACQNTKENPSTTTTGAAETTAKAEKKDLKLVTAEDFFGVWYGQYQGEDLYLKLQQNGDQLKVFLSNNSAFKGANVNDVDYRLQNGKLSLFTKSADEVDVEMEYIDNLHYTLNLLYVDITMQMTKKG